MRTLRRRSPSWRRDFGKTDKGHRRASRLRVLRRKHRRMAQALEAVTAAERKRDAHEKIQLGGVVIKAGLRTVDKAVLLGALLEVAALDPASDQYKRLKEKRLKEKGREAFQREAGG